ncbi:C40 family peptidase [Hymenobacter sp. DG25B]|jgi:cell wall-associated NlpC family hydrolase|uniref:C40 family peptidase n=1 Tax=Hymenobacter sp. DG25B TaxID=1385664 RepID=UPI00069495D7|nr:C40 family peptidase [Hymenobacter sp. DG25B]
MRYVWLSFFVIAAFIVGVTIRNHQQAAPLALADNEAPEAILRPTVNANRTPARPAVWKVEEPATAPNVARADSVIRFAMRQLGTNYCYAGATPETGFDCSGFVNYVFARFGVPVPHSTALLINTGREVPRSSARPGDIVVFTGTAATATTPGHAGIVISNPGEPLRFIHSSSARKESGVKISTVEKTDYERRFMAVRRVL